MGLWKASSKSFLAFTFFAGYISTIINLRLSNDRILKHIDYDDWENFAATKKNGASITRGTLWDSKRDGGIYKRDASKVQRRQRTADEADTIIANPAYSDLKEEIASMVANQTWVFKTSYEQSIIIAGKEKTQLVSERPPGATSKLVCRETCCVERVWISANQDDRKLLNWRNDIYELGDVMIQQFENDDASLHATNLHSEDLIPCFVPNTIISVDNFGKSIDYFWQQIRPKIKVPFLLVTGGSDMNSPYFTKNHATIPGYIADPLLLKWYGTNPRRHEGDHPSLERFREFSASKFRPLLSGLSYLHPQERYLSAYLGLTNYTNPFSEPLMKQRFFAKSADNAIDFEQDVFVHFGKKKNPFRKRLWNILCPNTKTNTTSCGAETNRAPLHEIYVDMTKSRGSLGQGYKFGISPPGMGYDCYRHYEMWYLGIIPVIWDRDPESYELYKNLPVLQLTADQQKELNSPQDFASVLQEFLESTEFRDAVSNGTYERGWNRLFLGDKRRAILKNSGRATVVDDTSGTEYYPAYRYFLREDVSKENGPISNTRRASGKADDRSVYCYHANANCAVRDGDGGDRSVDWTDDPNHEYNTVDQEWINQWEETK